MEANHNNATLGSGSGANKAKDDLELGAHDYSKQIDPAGEDEGRDGVVQTDAVFGEIVEGGPNYRAVSHQLFHEEYPLTDRSDGSARLCSCSKPR